MSNEVLKPTVTDPQFWADKWQKREIGFHQTINHPYLVKHLNKLVGENKSIRIFFPFCGKAVDMAWLASLGHEVVGVEYVETACDEFFSEQNIKFKTTMLKDFKLYESDDGKVKIYNGNFFKFNIEYENPFECVWDRGAFGALNPELRIKYAEHMKTLLCPKVRYLLDVFEYDTTLYPGPPHCVKFEEIQKLFGANFNYEPIESEFWMSQIKQLAEINQPFDKLYFLSRD